MKGEESRNNGSRIEGRMEDGDRIGFRGGGRGVYGIKTLLGVGVRPRSLSLGTRD